MITDSHQLQPDWLNAQCPREGRYVIGPLLGRGGMGNVHEAWDVVLCRTVALKILKDVEPAALIRFMHEAQIHARVVHPNICRIYDVDNYEGTLRVAMQLVHGANLEHTYRELALEELVTIMAQVAQAVHVVHRLNLIHRDLKPSNILLERGAEGQWIPYVCDFGLAMALDEPSLTYSHSVLGTPAYMAPEQFRGDRERISAATDIYALGGTLLFALTGRVPTAQGSAAGNGPNPPPIPRDLKIIIAKCMEEAPELRYPTAKALAEELWRFRQGEPIRASGRTTLSHLAHRWRRSLAPLKPYFLAMATALLVSAVWLPYQAHWQQVEFQRMALAQRLVLEAADMERNLRQERMLPIHDLRPSYARIRARRDAIRTRMPMLGARWQGQAYFALGCAATLVHDYAEGQEELEKAWAAGFHDPDVARWLGYATVLASQPAEQRAQFDQDLHPPVPAPAPGNLAAVTLRQAKSGDRDFDERADALTAYMQKDYLRGAASSRAAFVAGPWRYLAEAMESSCLTASAHQDLELGNLPQARQNYQQALAAGNGALALGRSDQAAFHATFQAARGLAALDCEQGVLPLGFLPGFQASCDQALRLDPDDPELQDDWLALRWLQAMALSGLGRDPTIELEAAKLFLGNGLREPLSAALRADRMVVFWQIAEWDFKQGRDPGPALAEALKTSGHTPFLSRDYLWEVLNFKARVDAARGADPRPTLSQALEHLLPLLQQGAPWSLRETLAESWLIRAEWESGHGLDSGSSIRYARTLAETVRHQNPDSGSAYALEGLAVVLELKRSPDRRRELLPLAQEDLKRSLAAGPGGRLKALLESKLRDPALRRP